MIKIVGSELNQWDTGRCVAVTGIEASYLHFANAGDSKAVVVQIPGPITSIPNFLFQTGKQLCVYAVENGITVESAVFPVRKRPRPENYVYEDDQRNYIYELIHDAQRATTMATDAAYGAEQTAQDLRDARNRGEFNGDPGPQGPKGEKGEPGTSLIDDGKVGEAAWSSKNTVDKLCPTFTESGTIVTCEPVEGYPLEVTTEDGATQITRCGKNLFDISKLKTTTIQEIQYVSVCEIAEVGADYIAVKSYPGFTGNGFCDTTVKFRELCPSVRAGDIITVNATTQSVQKLFYLSAGSVLIFGKTVTVTEEMLDSRLYVYGLANNGTTGSQGTGVCIVSNIQVEFGTSATAYEPYKEAETFAIGEQIPALPGGNILFADKGIITVKGKADPVAIINKLTNAILSLGGNV